MDLDALRFDDYGLIPVVAQDFATGEIRMLAFANREALHQTLATHEAHFFSRSRGALWKKGESSGHVLKVHDVWTDCDADAVVYLVDPVGPTCHTGKPSCFFDALSDGADTHASPLLPRLERALVARKAATSEKSYTRSLLDAGAVKIGEKVREEADEFSRACASESKERVISEAADVLYHVMVGLLSRDVSVRDVQVELARRFGVSGHDEKASRTPKA